MSLRQAINDKCRQCSHDRDAPGTWREQVAQCSVPLCPLWPIRPAPSGGPYATPPRDPAAVAPDWLRAAVGSPGKGHPATVGVESGPDAPAGDA